MYIVGAQPTVSGALDTNGNFFPLDSYAQTINRNGAGEITTIVVVGGGFTWTQTYTYESGQIKTISGWVKT